MATQPEPPSLSEAGVYSALPGPKSFRLLLLQPGDFEDPICCTLTHSELDEDEPPEYETISYCWGNENDKAQLSVNDVLVSVPQSSAAALRRLRLAERTRVVWIDAVCIDQNNFTERSQQVLLMRSVYRHGSMNLVHLGEVDMSAAFASVRSILNSPDAPELFDSYLNMIRSGSGFQFCDRNMIHATYDSRALYSLFSLDWFGRVWTYQEAVIPKHSVCFCQNSSIPLLDITRAALMLYYNGLFLDTDSGDLGGLLARGLDLNLSIDPEYGLAATQQRARSPTEIFNSLLHRQCARPVDRVYGMLGVVDLPGLVPDYNKPLTEVLQEALKLIAATDGFLAMLGFAAKYNQNFFSDRTRPSWVPGLTGTGIPLGERATPYLGSRLATSADGLWAYVPPLETATDQLPTNILSAKGFTLGKVASVSSLAAAGSTNVGSKQLKYAAGFINHVESLIARSPLIQDGPDSRDQAVTDIICGGLCWDDRRSGPHQLSPFRTVRELLASGRWRDLRIYHASDSILEGSEGIESDRNRMTLANRYAVRFLENMAEQKVFKLDTALVGSGPLFMEESDVVVILYGYTAPAVLRPEGDRYLFLGPAWVHGIMDGEAVTAHKAMGGIDEIYEIC